MVLTFQPVTIWNSVGERKYIPRTCLRIAKKKIIKVGIIPIGVKENTSQNKLTDLVTPFVILRS